MIWSSLFWDEYVLRNCKFNIQNIPVILKLSDWHFILISSQWIPALFTLQIYLSQLTYPFIFILNQSKTWDKGDKYWNSILCQSIDYLISSTNAIYENNTLCSSEKIFINFYVFLLLLYSTSLLDYSVNQY